MLHPEVVVLDIQLPDLDGLAVAERLAEAPDPPAVVLVSGREAVPRPSSLERERG